MKATTEPQAWKWLEEYMKDQPMLCRLEFMEAWSDWVNYRNTIGSPLTEYAVRRQCRKCDGFTCEEVCKALDIAMDCSWTSFFPTHEKQESDQSSSSIDFSHREYDGDRSGMR